MTYDWLSGWTNLFRECIISRVREIYNPVFGHLIFVSRLDYIIELQVINFSLVPILFILHINL